MKCLLAKYVIFEINFKHTYIVGKGGHSPPFLGQPAPPISKIPSFLEIQDVPIFYRPTEKTKVLNESFKRLLYKFYRQSVLKMEEYLLKW